MPKINNYWSKPVKRKKYMTKKRILAQKRKQALITLTIIIVSILIGIFTEAHNEFVIRDSAVSTIVVASDIASPKRSEEVILPSSELVINAVMVETEPTKEDVKNEIIKQSKEFGLNENTMLALAFCESGYNYKAKNPRSTARGVYQYLIGTWEETESARNGLERNNYKANIREAMIDISVGESWRWVDCWKKIGY